MCDTNKFVIKYKKVKPRMSCPSERLDQRTNITSLFQFVEKKLITSSHTGIETASIISTIKQLLNISKEKVCNSDKHKQSNFPEIATASLHFFSKRTSPAPSTDIPAVIIKKSL